jgi:uncharacterized protein (TIGR00725 family)
LFIGYQIETASEGVMTKHIVGIMGPGEKAIAVDLKNAYEIGRRCAAEGFVVMTGGRRSGVMEAALKGAKEAGGDTVGILPSKLKEDATTYADIVIATGMNSARNFVNVLTSDVLVACGMEAGTLSEVALALKERRRVILLTDNQKAKDFLVDLYPSLVATAENPDQALKFIMENVKNHAA